MNGVGFRAGDGEELAAGWLHSTPVLPHSAPVWVELDADDAAGEATETWAFPLGGARFAEDGYLSPELTAGHGWAEPTDTVRARAVYAPRAVRMLVERSGATVTLIADPDRIAEGDSDADEGEAAIRATVEPPQAEAFALTVSASSRDDARWEFVGANRTLSFAAGTAASTGSVRIRARHNAVDDGDVAVSVSADPGEGVNLPSAQAVVTLVDDEVPLVSVTSPCVAPCAYRFEAEAAAAATGTFVLTRDGSTVEALEVTVRVSEAGGDFVAAADEGERTLTIAAGQTSVDLPVLVTADTADESHGTVTVSLVDGPADGYDAAPGEGSATLAVRDDDGDLLVVTVDPAALSVREGQPAALSARAVTVADATFTEAGDLGRVFGATALSVKAATPPTAPRSRAPTTRRSTRPSRSRSPVRARSAPGPPAASSSPPR